MTEEQRDQLLWELWERLDTYGLTDEGKAGLLANFELESHMIPYRLEGDYNAVQDYPVSRAYTEAVDRGEKNESFWQDSKGYGLAQWTTRGRKRGLLNLAQSQGVSIADAMMQLDFAWQELQSTDYDMTRKELLTGKSISRAASMVCVYFERPYYCNIEDRVKAAQVIYDRCTGREDVMCNALQKRQHFVDVAETYLGRKESDGSHKQIIDVYNSMPQLPRSYRMSYTDPWCAAFVSAMGYAAGMSDVILPECSCDAMIVLYKARGQWVENDAYVPTIGDIVMYDWQDSGYGDCTGSADHVGIITSADGSTLKVIEGNISDAVGYRTLEVNGKYIRGYCVPDFGVNNGYGGSYGEQTEQNWHEDGDDEIAYVTPDKPTATLATCSVTLPELREGNTCEAVRSMQTLLIDRHFSCGDGADGELGPATLQAVKNFQGENGLEADGICGQRTWTKLIGGRSI